MSEKHALVYLNNGQAVRPIPSAEIPGEIYDIIEHTGKKFLTRNSRCPCGSGKRYKKCHGKEVSNENRSVQQESGMAFQKGQV